MALQDEQKKAQGEDVVAQWVHGVAAGVVVVVALRVVSINDVGILVARMGTVC